MVMTSKISISVEDLAVEYTSFEKGRILSTARTKKFTAISGISFEVREGEIVAIIGENGAGKTTLLKAIGGHVRPSNGEINTFGKVYTLSGANPGLLPDMSPRENVRRLSSVYGIEVERRGEFENEVEEFCELGEAFDRRYSTLSTGMAGRVGFGFTTSLTPEILLMDETLGVGDEAFRKKAEAKAREFMERGETILLSTHSLNLAKSFCTRGILLKNGKLIFDGDVGEAVAAYLES